MRIIAVVNQKGGVGKTTTSVNLGAALALRGRRVLLVDMDPQGNLTDHLLGDPEPGSARASIYEILVEGAKVTDCVVATTTPGLSVVPSHEDLAGAELDLASVIGREVILRDALADVPEDAWDYVFLDCPPSLGLLSLNALAAAHEVFIALQTEFFAMRGLGALDRTIDLVRRRINPRLAVGGIVPTLVDATRLSREVTDEVRNHYGELVFATRVRTNIRLAEAPSHGKHIFDYAPDSPGAYDYAALARELEEGRPAQAPPPAEAAVSAQAPGAASVRPGPGRPRGIARAIAEAMATLGVAPTAPSVAPTLAPPATPPTATSTPPPSPERDATAPGPTEAVAPASPVGTTPPVAAPADDVGPSAPAPAEPIPASPAAGVLVVGPHIIKSLVIYSGVEASEVDEEIVLEEAVPKTAPDPVPNPPLAVEPPVPPPVPEVSPAPAVSPVAAYAPAPAAAPLLRRPAVPLPVLRNGPRPLSIVPMPTRAPGALPRPGVASGRGPAS